MKSKKSREGGAGWDDYEQDSKDVNARANQRGGEFDSLIKDKFPTFSAKGTHKIRLLPPTWPDARHYGYDVWVHYNVGADNQSYACLEKHGKGTCPVCREIRRDPEGAKEMKAKRRVLVFLIDRDHEDEGPKVWAMPWTLDRDISGRAFDEDTQEALSIANPKKGYDVKFKREGEKLQTKYERTELARHATPLSDDDETMAKWRKFVTKYPLPSTIDFRTEEYIEKMLTGGDDEDEEGDDESEDETEEQEESEDEPRTRKQKKRERVKDDDEESEEDEPEEPDDDEESEDEDEDDPPPKKGKKPLSKKGREKFLRGKSEDDDELDEPDDEEPDDDEESEDEDEPEERKPPKGAKSSKLRDKIKKKLKDRDE